MLETMPDKPANREVWQWRAFCIGLGALLGGLIFAAFNGAFAPLPEDWLPAAGFVRILLIALGGAALYWWVVPASVRPIFLIVFSVIILNGQGGSLVFILWLLALIGAVAAATLPLNPIHINTAARWSGRIVLTALVVLLFTLLLNAARFVVFPASPPEMAFSAGLGLLAAVMLALWLWRRHGTPAQQRGLIFVLIALILLAFVILKSNLGFGGWLGFSYLAFRLLHVLLDTLKRQPPDYTPAELLAYSLFYPAQIVGPIDILPHFVEEARQQSKQPDAHLALAGGIRILMGGFKKYFVADVLCAPLLLSQMPAGETSTALAWLRLYIYAIYLYCDFSGFVDMMIGMGYLIGFRLPENFDRPYTKGSLAQFWQAWHSTLSGWLRNYVFLPFSRTLLRSRLRPYSLFIVLCAHLVTMSLIGLWHGFTLNFWLWGLWHGFGLFLHKAFADRTRLRQLKWRGTWRASAFHVLSVFLTVHFVILGWVFFALPTPQASLMYFARLLGVAP
jgi:alginate O-acetyltransferase complex protein AlgI